MPETRFIKFPALSVHPRVGISRSASETNDCLFFLSVTLRIIIYHLPCFHIDIYVAKQLFFERHSMFFILVQK